jgi:hypothetical protein
MRWVVIGTWFVVVGTSVVDDSAFPESVRLAGTFEAVVDVFLLDSDAGVMTASDNLLPQSLAAATFMCSGGLFSSSSSSSSSTADDMVNDESISPLDTLLKLLSLSAPELFRANDAPAASGSSTILFSPPPESIVDIANESPSMALPNDGLARDGLRCAVPLPLAMGVACPKEGFRSTSDDLLEAAGVMEAGVAGPSCP